MSLGKILSVLLVMFPALLMAQPPTKAKPEMKPPLKPQASSTETGFKIIPEGNVYRLNRVLLFEDLVPGKTSPGEPRTKVDYQFGTVDGYKVIAKIDIPQNESKLASKDAREKIDKSLAELAMKINPSIKSCPHEKECTKTCVEKGKTICCEWTCR